MMMFIFEERLVERNFGRNKQHWDALPWQVVKIVGESTFEKLKNDTHKQVVKIVIGNP